MKRLKKVTTATILMGLLAGIASAADIVVVDDENLHAYYGLYGSAAYADQPRKLFADVVAWAVDGESPDCVTVLLYTYDGTLNDDPNNINSLGFYNLLIGSGYTVLIDHQSNVATRTDYSNIDLVIYPNLDDRSAANVIASELPFITMEPGQTDELNIGGGAATFSGTVNEVLVVDNDHVVTDDYDLGQIIPLAQNGAPQFPFDVPTETINTSGDGHVLIGQVPEPATMALILTGVLAGAAYRRRRD